MTATTNVRVTESVFDCPNCANILERVLHKETGVTAVVTDEEARELEIRFDQSRIGEPRLRQLVDEWGYAPDQKSA